MEVALTLIHQIQDEMGTRHSQLVERLKADIESTHARLKKYLGDGVEQSTARWPFWRSARRPSPSASSRWRRRSTRC
jgi:hypothetical protein